jgi:hypothetical protein
MVEWFAPGFPVPGEKKNQYFARHANFPLFVPDLTHFSSGSAHSARMKDDHAENNKSKPVISRIFQETSTAKRGIRGKIQAKSI